MPREIRKRGKKHKRKAEDDIPESVQLVAEPQAGPSWIVPAPDRPEINQEAPFGYVDAELKAYFRTVDLQVRDWQEEGTHRVETTEDVDPNEDRRLFVVAALTEMSGKEKQLATDPDCSAVLERMAYSMDDFVRRVFIDRLCGSFEQLVKHRFASHVCQTLFTVASDTISRESRGIFPPSPETSDEGELRTLKQLVLDVCEEIIPVLPSLIMDQFASHVVRALLSLLSPHLFPQAQQKSAVRSKKSAAFKAKQGVMKSVLLSGSSDDSNPRNGASKTTPEEFSKAARDFVMWLREKLDQNEVRALAANQVASPVLQMLLEVEADQILSNEPDSLMDRVLAGMITTLRADPTAVPEPSDYVGTLLRDPTSSHLLETLVLRSPEDVFNVIWTTYFTGKLQRLSVHPVANFVVARALERVNDTQLKAACEELDSALNKLLKTSRTGVLRAIVDRAATLHAHEDVALQTILSAFGFATDEDAKLLVPCVLHLLPLNDYENASSAKLAKQTQGSKENDHYRGNGDLADPMEPKTQGAVLLQSMLRLSPPHNERILDSIESLSTDELLSMAQHVTSSRVFDALLDLPSVPAKFKRNFVLAFIGHFHILVDDRIGSRVGDRCWAYADPYLREKIARSVIPQEHALAASFYGKFFARHLNLYLLKRDPEEWKNVQANSKVSAQSGSNPTSTQPPPPQPSTSSGASTSLQDDHPYQSTAKKSHRGKRKSHPDDEIDQLFDNALGKKVKRAGLGDVIDRKSQDEEKQKKDRDNIDVEDKSLNVILGAIKSAPKDSREHRKKKRTK